MQPQQMTQNEFDAAFFGVKNLLTIYSFLVSSETVQEVFDPKKGKIIYDRNHWAIDCLLFLNLNHIVLVCF